MVSNPQALRLQSYEYRELNGYVHETLLLLKVKRLYVLVDRDVNSRAGSRGLCSEYKLVALMELTVLCELATCNGSDRRRSWARWERGGPGTNFSTNVPPEFSRAYHLFEAIYSSG